MKKNILFLFISLLVSTYVYAQQPYYDALKLREQIDTADNEWAADDTLVPKILSKYCNRSAISTSFKQNNPFIRPFMEHTNLEGTTASGGRSAGDLIRSAGNMDVTVIADGIARFLVRRVKEELTVAFFSRLQTLLAKKEFEDARTLFPQTNALLNTLGDQIYNYNIFLNSLRDAFGNDLDALLDHLPEVVNNPNYASFFDKHKELKAILLSSIYIGEGMKQQQHPGAMLAGYNTSLLDELPKDLKATVQTLQLFSESLRSQGTDHYWIDKDSLKLLKDPITLQIYLGLVYQQAVDKHIQFDSLSLTAIMSQNTSPLTYLNYIQGFIAKTTDLTRSIKVIAAKPDFKDYHAFYDHTLDLFEYALQVNKLPGVNITIPPNFINIVSVMRAGGNISRDLSVADYGSALVNTFRVYQYTLGEHPDAKISGKTNPDKVAKFLLQYGATIAAIAQADSSSQVATALENAVLPPGSSSTKRVSIFNISLNAYTGLFAGHEFIKGVSDKLAINSYGVTAPIGFAFSWGHKLFFANTKQPWSTSLFISLIDLGAVAAYRFGDDTTASVPSIQLKNIVSPGAFLSIGIPKTPLSVNLGAQIGPNLRKVDNNSGSEPSKDYDNRLYWRLSAGVVVDIPLLNLFTR